MISIIYADRFFRNDPVGKTLPDTEIGQIIQKETAGGLRDYGVMFFRWYHGIRSTLEDHHGDRPAER